jgi:hypothetical protein
MGKLSSKIQKKLSELETLSQDVEVPQKQFDPRPDLTEDTHLWETLILLSTKVKRLDKFNQTLTAVLNGFRCGGTKLVAINGKYVIRPIIGADYGWTSQKDYDYWKNKYLMSWVDDLKPLLIELQQHYEVSPDG